jgi:hypothetical protein
MPHACDGTRVLAWAMSFTAAVFQLPMFWLNADAPLNACRADPTPSTQQRTQPSAPAVPRHSAIHHPALYNDATSGASSHSLVATRHHVSFIDGTHKTRSRSSQTEPTSAPGLVHICAGTRPHPRWAIPTSAPGTTCGWDHFCEKGRRLPAACVQRQKGAYADNVRHSRGVPAADVLVERRRRVKRLPSRPHAVHTAANKAQRAGASAPRPQRHTSRCSILVQRGNKWCFIAQPRCNTPTCNIHRQKTPDSFTVEPHLGPLPAPGLAHICTATRPHPRWAIPTSAPGTACGRDHCCGRTSVARRMRATAQGRIPGTYSKHSLCSSYRCSD